MIYLLKYLIPKFLNFYLLNMKIIKIINFRKCQLQLDDISPTLRLDFFRYEVELEKEDPKRR